MTDTDSPRDDAPVEIDEPEMPAAVERHDPDPDSVSPEPAHHIGVGQNAVPLAVRVAAGWAWRFVAIVLATALVLWMFTKIKTVVIPVFVAALITALLAPLTNALTDRLGLPRAVSAAFSLLLAIGTITGLVLIVSSNITEDARQLGLKAVEGFNEVVAWLSTGPLNLEESAIQEYIDQLQVQVSRNMNRIISGAMSVTSSVGHIFAGSLIAIFCLFFFLKDGRQIWSWVVRLFPVSSREFVDGAGLRSWISLGAYTRTQIIVALVDGIGIGLGAYLLKVPLAVPIGVLVFLGSFIPIVGATVTGAVAVAVALVDSGLATAVAMFVVVLLVQQLESNLLQPMLMSKALSLHPVGVLLAVAAGTILAGIVGALFAVPLLAVVNTVLLYLNGHDPVPPSRRDVLLESTRKWRRV